jgi:hypothetical protein
MKVFTHVWQRNPILILALLICFDSITTEIKAQGSGQERASVLRTQLVEVVAKRKNLETRLRQLEEESQPANIERSLAGIGSTHPEDLRDSRRRQLEVEKTSIQTQLKLLAETQTRLEGGILKADAIAYHQSAGIEAERKLFSPDQQTADASRVGRCVRRSRGQPKRRGTARLTQY